MGQDTQIVPSPTSWIDEPRGVHPESDLGNAHRIRYHCSDRLRYGEHGWETYANGVWRIGEAGALAHASQLGAWIAAEAADSCASRELDSAPDAHATRLAWGIESQSCQRIEAALKLAMGLMANAGEATAGAPGYSARPSHREQSLAAMLAVLSADDTGLRSNDSGRLIATKLCKRVEQMAPVLWPGSGAPPLAPETLERIASAALKGDVTAGAGRAAKKSSARI